MNAAPVLWVDLGPGVRAGFTMRGSGGSPPPWSGLNVGLGVGDDRGRVVNHRRRIGDVLGVPVLFATQVHGVRVLDVTGIDAGRAVAEGTVGDADALVSARVDTGIGVLVADCVPVLLADSQAEVVGVAHAGRQGLDKGVIPAVIAAMAARGARPGHVRAVVGPCICGSCYEVPSSMRDDVALRRPRCRATTLEGTPALDLPTGVLGDLAASGVGATRIEVCTKEDERFFSHRRATEKGTTTGRFAGIIRLVQQT